MVNYFSSQCVPTIVSRNVSDLVKMYIPNDRLRSNSIFLFFRPKLLRTETTRDFTLMQLL